MRLNGVMVVQVLMLFSCVVVIDCSFMVWLVIWQVVLIVVMFLVNLMEEVLDVISLFLQVMRKYELKVLFVNWLLESGVELWNNWIFVICEKVFLKWLFVGMLFSSRCIERFGMLVFRFGLLIGFQIFFLLYREMLMRLQLGLLYSCMGVNVQCDMIFFLGRIEGMVILWLLKVYRLVVMLVLVGMNRIVVSSRV